MTENKIKVLIADDEPLARKRLRKLLSERDGILLAGECRNGREAVASIRELSPDLVLLDIQMPDLDGFGVIEEIGSDSMPVVVFVTAYDVYALEAFSVCALDYLLKPFDNQRFQQALDRALNQIRLRQTVAVDNQLNRLLAAAGRSTEHRAEGRYRRRFPVQGSKHLYFVETKNIDWVQAEGSYIRLHTGSKSHLIRGSIKKIESELDPCRFVRIHRSAIVQIERIEALYPRPHGEYDVILQDGTALKLSRGYRGTAKGVLGI